jgi:hypothetical protein
MPYILKQDRERLDGAIQAVMDALESETPIMTMGEINYVISSIFWKLFNRRKSYAFANDLIGVLECVKLELYRRHIAPYEDEKIKQNGDIVLTSKQD